MNPPVRCIAVLGAPGTGAPELIGQLRQRLAAQADLRVTDQIPPQSEDAFALLMGLDPWLPAGDAVQHKERLQLDAELRQQLQSCGLAYRVIYGPSSGARLANALHALGRVSVGDQTAPSREQTQFDLNRGRTPWSCEACSDPGCEHRLFTQLLRQQVHGDPQVLSAPSPRSKEPAQRP
ncbi:MAG: hypothetical protein ACKOWC_04690 [Limnohabitans sp.]